MLGAAVAGLLMATSASADVAEPAITSAWSKIADAGSTVEVINDGDSPVVVAPSAAPPQDQAGRRIERGQAACLTLTQDLYAHAAVGNYGAPHVSLVTGHRCGDGIGPNLVHLTQTDFAVTGGAAAIPISQAGSASRYLSIVNKGPSVCLVSYVSTPASATFGEPLTAAATSPGRGSSRTFEDAAIPADTITVYCGPGNGLVEVIKG